MSESNPFRAIGIIGAGTMGTGIAIVVARAGIPTLLFDIDAAAPKAARERARTFLEKSVALGKLPPGAFAAAMDAFIPCERLEELARCDLIIEAVFESAAVKGTLLAKLHELCPAHTVLATNTSTLSVTQLAGASGRPDRVVGLHFCLPAERMRLVEVTPSLTTAESTLRAAIRFCEVTGQHPIVTQDRPGFILNALAIPLHNSAIRLVEAGIARPASIDRAIRHAFGHAMGPFELLDLVGLDTQVLLSEALHAGTNDPRAFCPPLLRRMAAAGWLGAKRGGGFHAHFPETLPEAAQAPMEILGDLPGASNSILPRSERGAPMLVLARGAGIPDVPRIANRQLIVQELGTEELAAHTELTARAAQAGVPLIGFAPYHTAPGVAELVVPDDCPAEALAAALALARALDLVPALCRDRPGRILDRLIRPYLNDALRAVDEGLASAADIDFAARTGLGYREGPITLVTRTGLSRHREISRDLFERLGEIAFMPARAARVAAAGRANSR